MTTFSKRLKAAREAKGLTQGELAKAIGKPKGQSLIGNLESGGRNSTTFIPEIANALGVSAYWLKTGKGQRDVSATPLSKDQETILQAFDLFGQELKQNWLSAAQAKVAEHEASKTKAA